MSVTRNDLETTEKRTTAKMLYAFNYRRWIKPGVVVTSIVSITVMKQDKVPASTNLVVTGEAFEGTRVTAFFDAGTSGESYLAVAEAVLSDGQRIPLACIINVLDRTE